MSEFLTFPHPNLLMCGDDRKEFGLESFISPTLLSNMREKDLRKAISYHLKKIQSLLEPRQKVDTDCFVMVYSVFLAHWFCSC